MCKDQLLCVKHVFEPIFENNHQCTKEHKVRVFITIIVKTFLGGKLEGLGGEGGGGGKLPPHTPQ